MKCQEAAQESHQSPCRERLEPSAQADHCQERHPDEQWKGKCEDESKDDYGSGLHPVGNQELGMAASQIEQRLGDGKCEQGRDVKRMCPGSSRPLIRSVLRSAALHWGTQW